MLDRLFNWLDTKEDLLMGHLPQGLVKNPWEAFISGLGLLGGLGILLGPSRPRSVEESLPHTVVLMWAISLLAGCLLVFYGLVRQHILPERIGLQLLCSSSLTYAVVAMFALGVAGTITIFPYLGFAGASLVQLWLLKKGFRMSRALRGNDA